MMGATVRSLAIIGIAVQLENGLYADVYAPEIIILIAFRLNTYMNVMVQYSF